MKLSQLFKFIFFFLIASTANVAGQIEVQELKNIKILPFQSENGEHSFISTTGVHIPFGSFEEIVHIPEAELFLVKSKDKWGAISDSESLKTEFDTIYSVQHFLIANKEDSTYIYSHEEFSLQLKTLKGKITTFGDKGEFLLYERNGNLGLIADFQPHFTIRPNHKAIREVNSFFVYQTQNNQYGAVNRSGKEIISPQSNFIYAFNDDILRHQSGANWTYYKKNGKPFPISGKLELEVNGHGFYKVHKGGKVYLYNDATDQLLDVDKYDNYYPLSKNQIAVLSKGKVGLFNAKLKSIIPFEYQEISIFNEKFFLAKKNNKYGLITAQNKVIIPFEFDYFQQLYSKDIISYKAGKAGYHKANGLQVIDNLYKGFMNWHGLIISYNQYTYGVYTSDFKLISEPKYNRFAFVSTNGITIMKVNNKFTIFNSKGMISADAVDQFSLSNNTIKTYKKKDIEIITINEQGKVLEHEKYPNMISVKIDEKVKEETYTWETGKPYPDPTFLYQSQLQGKWGVKYRFEEGYKVDPTYTQIYPTRYSSEFIVKDTIAPYEYSIGGLKFKVNLSLAIINNSNVFYKHKTTHDTHIHIAGKTGKNHRASHEIMVDSLGNIKIQQSDIDSVQYADEYLESDVKRYNINGKLAFQQGKTFQASPSSNQYYNRINQFNNLTVEDHATRKMTFNPTFHLNIKGGKWFYKDYGYYQNNREKFYFKDEETYESASDFKSERSIAVKEGKTGVLNQKNKVIIPFEYYNIQEIKTGKNFFYKTFAPNNELVLVNQNNQQLFPNSVSIADWNNHHFTFIHQNKLGLMDTSGKVLFCAQFNQIEDLNNHRVLIAKTDSFGLISTSGKKLTPFKYSSIKRNSEQLFTAYIGKVKTVLNAQGKVIIPADHKIKQCEFDMVLTKKNDSLFVFNNYGRMLFGEDVPSLKIMSKEVLMIKSEAYIDLFNFKKDRDFKMKKVRSAKNIRNPNFILVTTDAGKSILSNNGTAIIQDAKIKTFKNGWFAVKENKTWNLHSPDGNVYQSNIQKFGKGTPEVIEIINGEETTNVQVKKAVVAEKPIYKTQKLSDFEGLISFTGDVIFKPKYDKIKVIYKDFIYVEDHYTQYYYQIKNKKPVLIWKENLPRYSSAKNFNCN